MGLLRRSRRLLLRTLAVRSQQAHLVRGRVRVRVRVGVGVGLEVGSGLRVGVGVRVRRVRG